MVKLEKDLFAVKPGEVYPQLYVAGTDCPAELVDIAKEIGVLELGTKSIKSAPENKALKTAPERKGGK